MVQGIAQLTRKLTVTMPAKVEAATRAAMEKGADELVAMMKRLAPVLKEPDRRRRPGELRDSIGWTWGDAPKGAIVLAESKADSRGLKITVFAGNEKAYYARWVEFGVAQQQAGQKVTDKSGRTRKSRRTTKGGAAQPFFFPSYRAMRKRIKSRITRAMKKAIQSENAT
ncbi:HK97-gp10 family putative phage morphogenesis protein [Aminobacter sp. BE322]|uniref:HK97-gp10 family putative phage morphogenesis protein n=1 Tax=unclassified Aminobacter TaxID=2644704 RepID=UPI003D246273